MVVNSCDFEKMVGFFIAQKFFIYFYNVSINVKLDKLSKFSTHNCLPSKENLTKCLHLYISFMKIEPFTKC
jgi:hypothetical protein